MTCLRSRRWRGAVPGPQVPDSQAEEPASAPTLALSGTLALPPHPHNLGLGQPSRRRFGGTRRPPRETEACSHLRPPPPPTCRSLGSRQSPASGASRERRPASPAPTAGRRAEQRPGTALPPARRKWLRAGPAHRAHAPERGLRQLREGGWTGTAGGRGHRRGAGRSLRPAGHVSKRPDPRRNSGYQKPFFAFCFQNRGRCGAGGVVGAWWQKRKNRWLRWCQLVS